MIAPACLLPALFPPNRGNASRCTSPAANTPVKICATCSCIVPQPWPRRCRCPMPCRATPLRFPKASRSYWPTVWRMAEGSLWKSRQTSRKHAATFWKRWVKSINMMRKHAPPNCLRRSALLFHQQHSEPLMKTLRDWMEAQFAQHLVEPNSGLGKAITYFLRHWKGLTAFLRDAGAPLDNNICERALKRAVLHRKNALFYRTLHGSEVGDLFMSLIHTCELAGRQSLRLSHRAAAARARTRQRILQSGCPGTIARRWPGSPHRPPRNMINPAWPKRIVSGHSPLLCGNAHKTGFSRSEIQQGFWPPPSRRFVCPRFHTRSTDTAAADPHHARIRSQARLDHRRAD